LEVDAKVFGKYLKDLRKNKGYTLTELGEIIGYSNPYLSQIETGQKGIPSPDFLKKLATGLETDFLNLMRKAGHIPEKALAQIDDSINDLHLIVHDTESYTQEINKISLGIEKLKSEIESCSNQKKLKKLTLKLEELENEYKSKLHTLELLSQQKNAVLENLNHIEKTISNNEEVDDEQPTLLEKLQFYHEYFLIIDKLKKDVEQTNDEMAQEKLNYMEEKFIEMQKTKVFIPRSIDLNELLELNLITSYKGKIILPDDKKKILSMLDILLD